MTQAFLDGLNGIRRNTDTTATVEDAKTAKAFTESHGDDIATVEPASDLVERAKIDTREEAEYNAYQKSIEIGELSPLVEFSLYRDMSAKIDTQLIGKRTSNGILIKGKSKHFIARVFGSVEQRRNGVKIDEVFSAVSHPLKIDEITMCNNKNSQKFIGDTVSVSINPDTGVLIQANPLPSKNKEDQK